jgi:curved DNA-binding protein CbpA
MPIKDHYKTLGIPTNASATEVKKAYRLLAHKYHPDKNPGNPHAAAHFREVREAYHHLSDTKKRRNYDEERYFSGLTAQREPIIVTSQWLLTKALALEQHMQHIDSYRMSHKALYDYVSLLLSESHLAILKQENDPPAIKTLVKSILQAVRKIEFPYFLQITGPLTDLAGPDEEIRLLIAQNLLERKKSTALERKMPLIIVLIAFFLCLIMYLYSRQT